LNTHLCFQGGSHSWLFIHKVINLGLPFHLSGFNSRKYAILPLFWLLRNRNLCSLILLRPII
jgi:hypothetical protein